VLYQSGQGVEENDAQARTLYQKACDGGDVDGCNWLGVLYEKGRGGARDQEQARALYKKACDGGVGQACTNLRNLH